jgi:hypothetical protein
VNGWELVKHGRSAGYYYRPVARTAGALIEALATLPPETMIDTTAGPEGVDELSYITYWPDTKTASLG